MLPTPSAEDAAMGGVGVTRVLIRLSMNLPANPLRFIMAIPRPVSDQLRQPYD